MYTLVVRFDLPDQDKAAAFDALAAQAIPVIRANEPGTLTYVPYRVEGEPLARMFFEVYQDAEAHDEHGRQPHTVECLAAIRALVTSVRVEQLIG
jgi:quinol monooxygenase YgiN